MKSGEKDVFLLIEYELLLDTNNLSDASFDAPYKFTGLLALSVDNATTRLTP